MSGWEGYGVSVRCGALGCYQGTVAAADGGSITLTKPFRNGFPYPKARVTLKASDIEALEIISEREEAAPAHSTVLAGGRRRAPRATVGESLQAPKPANSSSGNSTAIGKPAASSSAAPAPGAVGVWVAGGGGADTGAGAAGGAGGPAARARAAPARSKPIDIQGSRPAKTNMHAGSCGAAAAGSTPKARGGAAGGGGGGGGAGGDRARRRNEACFGAAALDDVQQDFDFEGNLALFDKEALWQQMRPDVVRVAAARDELVGGGGKLRHDQHVLRRAKPDTEPVHVPDELRGPDWYVTDDGVRVPSLSVAARRRLWADLAAAPELHAAALTLLARCVADVALRLMGGTRRYTPLCRSWRRLWADLAAAPELHAAALTLLARCVADVALRLMGGTRRLDPRNAHQRPVFGACVGAGAAAAAGVQAARLLAAHGVDTFVAAPAAGCPLLGAALAGYAAGGGTVLAPRAAPPPDVLLVALHDPACDQLPANYWEVVSWAAGVRGALLLLEPGGGGGGEGAGWAALAGAARASLVALLPGAAGGAGGAGGAGAARLLLANVAPPPQLFLRRGVRYRPPFGAAAVLPLHRADDEADAA